MATNTIDLTTAQNWISAWRANPDLGVKAFFIPKDDMVDLLNDTTCIGVRGYLAFGNTGGLPDEAKLVLVSVDGDITTGGTDNLNNGIYDFTNPCPQTCDVTSPLYTLDDSRIYPPVTYPQISLQDAVLWAKTWRQAPITTVKAFFIPKIDITDMLKDTDSIGVRAYLGFGTIDTKSDAEAKLMMVSVEIDSQSNEIDRIDKGIYDFTNPCPQTCDVNSQLYTLLSQTY
jgi:hypothetical protein